MAAGLDHYQTQSHQKQQQQQQPTNNDNRTLTKEHLLKQIDDIQTNLRPLLNGGEEGGGGVGESKRPSATGSGGSAAQQPLSLLLESISFFSTSCSDFADELPPHGRFQCREKLDGLDNGLRQLRSAPGGGGGAGAGGGGNNSNPASPTHWNKNTLQSVLTVLQDISTILKR